MVERIDHFAERLGGYSGEEKKLILEAANWSEDLHRDQMRASGEPYFIHPLQVAEILVDMRMDSQCVIAALLHDVLEDTDASRQELRLRFGKDVENLVNGVTKIAGIKAKNKSVQEAETIRKMLFAMSKDIRVILIKLADKLHNMRTLEFLAEDRRRTFAQECLDIYAPLASRLGMGWIKDELEDLALKNLQRDTYNQIKAFVSSKRGERADYLQKIEEKIQTAAQAEGLTVEVKTRAKHFYSIYTKMRRRSKTLDEIFDLLGIRILCEAPTDCYIILGIVHRLWKPIDGRFKDYIAMPKSNRYQSLHTTVMGDGGRLIEIQIRTVSMNQTAEHGIAAHWLYKRGTTAENVRREDLPIINRLKNWNGVKISSRDFLEEIKGEILKDSIYVFTPKGDAIELPKGSTAIDFAYYIHTDIGDHLSAAKADGLIIPLKAELKNTQVIEVITAKNSHPHLTWLRYVKTARARTRIRSWLKKSDESLIIEKNIVARKKAELPITMREPRVPHGKKEAGGETLLRDEGTVGIRIGDEKNMLINLARCCNPAVGDEIIGYVSRGRGIIVHRKDCSNVKAISGIEERTIHVEWETVSPRATRHFRVAANRTYDLFSEIEGAVKKYQGHLVAGRVEDDGPDRLLAVFTMELDRAGDFRKVIKSIQSIPSVLRIDTVYEDASHEGDYEN
ncbi:MAG: bifunctional (p)ppGpp synthetase/guanosine-3',5'-bis(diphosphate) 3'-pyrophosphohydrolase [Spirochaetales bacterium]|nr:bifunctional (p)ppGpp synthetase/guanosine-3',5'-bis(diphosphate) 3'-pyrophosphohydrolase [Spirochaetales bacterium]